MSTAIYVNGRWIGQALTGVQRFATEICKRLVVARQDRIHLVLPKGVPAPDWAKGATIVRGRTRGIVFEQLELPWIARRGRLLAMSGPFSVLGRRQVAVMHDAIVFACPDENTRLFRLWYRFLYRFASRRLSHRVTVSDFSARELAKYTRVPVEDYVVAWNGGEHVDEANPVRPNHILPNRYFAILGTLVPRKNVAPVVRAFEECGVPLVVVGGMPNSRVFRSDSVSGKGSATYLGRISDDEVAWVLANAEALIFPSVYEGFGIPVLEAQRLGCPVVASEAASIPEVAGSAALYFNPLDPKASARLATRILNDDALGRSLRDAGYRNAARFSWERSARIVLEALDSVSVT